MADYPDEFNDITGAQAEKAKAQALDDFNNEIGGRDTGRIARFIAGDAGGPAQTAKRDEREARDLSNLQMMLLNNPAYARLYRQTFDKLRDAERLAAEALAFAEEQARAVEAELDAILDRAATLPNGTKVFRDDQGRVRAANGAIVDDAIAASIVWRGDEPDYATYRNAADANTDADARVTAIRSDQVKLGDIRNRLTDQDRPPSADDLRGIGSGIDTITNRLKAFTNPEVLPSGPEASTSISLPDLKL